MVRRVRRRLGDAKGGAYFLSPPTSVTFVHSGATPLDCILGGGWPLERVSNIVGDKSTGKTLLALEAMANFIRTNPGCRAKYAESESAFEDDYAGALGIPVKKILRPKHPLDTVEEFHDDVQTYMSEAKKAGFYVLDSLDALSDAAELDRDIGEKSYGASKAKQMSETFRRCIRSVENSHCHVMIINQIRDRIGVAFGRKYSRSGGRALDFYASQVIYLAHIGEIKHKIGGVTRTVGVNIKIRCTKNKIGLPFRECTVPILFGYGIEDICACIDWLVENKQTERTGLTKKELKEIRSDAIHSRLEDVDDLRGELSQHVRDGWQEVERSFLPTRRKYQ